MEDERDDESEKELFVMKKGIVAENISFQYDKNLPMILNNTSFYINKGEWIGIVGESGAGKSTLFQLLLRFYDIVSRDDELDSLLGENGLLLSGGQRQRIGLAQGLLRNSQILLLDEVTANIDNKSEHDIRKLIHGLQKEKGLTVISISHRMNFLSQADRIYELKDGKLRICD